MLKLAPFSQWPRFKLLLMNENLGERSFSKDQAVYDFDQKPTTVFVVYLGALVMECCLEIDTFFKIPVAKDCW